MVSTLPICATSATTAVIVAPAMSRFVLHATRHASGQHRARGLELSALHEGHNVTMTGALRELVDPSAARRMSS